MRRLDVDERAEEAERQRIQNTKVSKEGLFAIIEAWGVAKRIEGFFDDAQRRADEQEDGARDAILERLERPRATRTPSGASLPGGRRFAGSCEGGARFSHPRVSGHQRAPAVHPPGLSPF